MVATARYCFGRTLGMMATVPSGLTTGLVGQRDGHMFRVTAPDTRVASEPSSETMWCGTFDVEVRKLADDVAGLDPDEALGLTARIARDCFTQLVLCAPNLGFPGATPQRESADVRIDGESAPLDYGRHRDPNAVMIVGGQVASLTDLQQAAAGEHPPSRARMMVAEAGYQVLFNPNASQVTAVIVAASACEIAAHECVRRNAEADLGRLASYLVPPGQQAKLSPSAVIDNLIPALTGRRLADDNSALWGRVKGLLRARDEAVHQGSLPPNCSPMHLVKGAEEFVKWVEGLA